MKRTNIYTDKPVDRKYQYSPAVVHKRSGLLFISGVCGWDRDGNIMHADDVTKQAEVTFENLADILKAAGVGFADIIWETEYVVDMRQYRDIAKVRARYFPDNFPAATLVGASALFKPNQLFEIQAIAALE
ncbi:MAG TPA: RidA family protein [Rhizobiaceae bacterium]|nr:RidA family protein [Rhizobiaceae bacterium]